MADRQGALAGVTGNRARVYYNDSGWKEVQGIGSMEIGTGSATTNTYNAFEGSFSEAGSEEIGQVTFEAASYQPAHRSWRWLEGKRAAGDDVTLRVESRQVTIAPATTGNRRAAIATTGVVTFSGGASLPSSAARGHALLIDGDIYVIESISDATNPVVTVTAPNSAVSADNFAVIFPILRWVVSGSIAQMPGATLGLEAAITGQLVIQPRVRVALPSPQSAHSVA